MSFLGNPQQRQSGSLRYSILSDLYGEDKCCRWHNQRSHTKSQHVTVLSALPEEDDVLVVLVPGFRSKKGTGVTGNLCVLGPHAPCRYSVTTVTHRLNVVKACAYMLPRSALSMTTIERNESVDGNGMAATYVVEPTSEHTHSIILLHGLGSNGLTFGGELLNSSVTSGGKSLTEMLPGAKFIFPTAKRRRSSAFHRANLTQWFDIASLADPSYRRDRQIQGLEESYQQILRILKEERDEIPPSRIILGGISHGCAMALMILLAIDFPLGGFIGMSGWLPFTQDINALLPSNSGDSGEDDHFTFGHDTPVDESDRVDDEVQDSVVDILNYVRDLLSLDDLGNQTRSQSAISTPVFLGHGDADEKIAFSLGSDAQETMLSIGFNVNWHVYCGHGHSCKVPDEIDDIVDFIRVKVGWDIHK